MAQQPTNRQPPAAGALGGVAGAAIDAERVYKATVFVFLDDNLLKQYRYYWWRDSCYVRYQLGNYESVPSDACN